jgi:1L-myo-inositol 1-phosphate cytidylyltransferase
MKCLILAAGLGTRLREASDSKPLTPLAGKPLIEHVIERAASAGVTGFVVVTGHQADKVEAFLTALRERSGLAIEWVRADDWHCANGYSVVAGSAAIDGNFLLLMSDHLFDPAIVRRLIESAPADAAVTLVVDRDLSGPYLDIDDATKVELAEDGRILRIGKTLERFDAIDTGIFLATPALAEAIRADIAGGGGGSLSEGMQRLADAGHAATVDIGSARWVDTDDLRMLALAERFVAAEAVSDNAA